MFRTGTPEKTVSVGASIRLRRIRLRRIFLIGWCNGDHLRVAGQAHDAHALGAARQQAYAADVHADYRAVVGDDEQILVAGDDNDVCDGAGLIGDVVVFKSHAAAVLHAVFADVGALAVAVFGYAQYRRALGRDTRADDIVALAQADAAHADRIASHCARVGLGKADGHAVMRCKQDLILAGGLQNAYQLVALIQRQGADAVRAYVLERRLRGALDSAVARDEHEVVVLGHAAACDHGADLLAGVGGDDIDNVLAARRASGLGDAVALADIHLAEIRDSIEADTLAYLGMERLKELNNGLPYCDACFSGNYPIEPPTQDIRGEQG